MRIVVAGAGPSGLHFALTALARGHRVTLVDAGHTGDPVPLPQADLYGLKEGLADPVRHFLGASYGSASLPPAHGGEQREYYGLPASKDYVFRRPGRFKLQARGMAPLLSFAAGGLAQCWTGGAYAFDDGDLAPFGFGYARMAPYYAQVAERIGIGGAADALAEWYPGREHLREPVPLDQSSALLLQRYGARQDRLAQRHPGVRLGRSRQAALAAPMNGRGGCLQCGRCLWGCPNGAFYTPALTLAECLKHPRFDYRPGRFASHFTLADAGSLAALAAYPSEGGSEEIAGDAFVLACGTISSANLFLRTLWKAGRGIARLDGLMDNQQVLAPFLNLAMLGRPHAANSYQYHQLAVALQGKSPAEFVHGQITTLTTGEAHPVMAQLPLGMGAARRVFTTLRSALGVVNLNFSDSRRGGNGLTLAPDAEASGADGFPPLRLSYTPPDGQDRQIAAALSRLGGFMRGLGAPLVPGMTQIRPPGASVHYSGTLPVSAEGGAFTVTESCQSNDFANLFVVDGSVFPALPAKNLTFTLMANATRVAAEAF
ncbi:GMC oxidoreductase (plasmid) [Roseobacteraceae bacterium NS-SX3]